MNGQHPLNANKSWCLSVGADVLLQAILLLWPKEEREVPAWSRSHPLQIEHLSLLVMDVTKSCSCLDTIGGGRVEKIDGREQTRKQIDV